MRFRRRAIGARGLVRLAALVAAIAAFAAQAQTPPAPSAEPQPAATTTAPVEPPAGPPPPPAPPAGPAAIPTFEVASSVEGAYAQLNQIQAIAEPDPLIAQIEKEALGKERLFHERVVDAAQTLQGEVTLDDLDEIQARASSADKQLKVWQRALSERSAQLEKGRAQLEGLRETWSLTLDRAREEKAPGELIENIKALRTEIRSVDKALDDRFDSILKLQGLIAEESLAVSVLSQDLRRARFEVRGRLFERDRLPLHAAFFAVHDVEPVLDRVRDGLERDVKSIRTFASLEGGQRIIVHVLVFLGLLLLAVRMRSWSQNRRRSGKTLGPTEGVFDHPVATSLLFAVLLTPWIHPFLPRSYQNLLGLLTIVPITVLLPNVLAPAYRRVWYALIALFILDRTRGVFAPVDLLERSIFLVETIGAGALAALVLHRDRLASLVSPRFHGAFRTMLRLTVAAFVVATVANLAGFVSLANLVGQGVLRSMTTAVVLYAAVNVTRPLVAGLLRTAPSKRLHILQERREAVELWVGRGIGAFAMVWWLARALEGFSLGDRLNDGISTLLTAPLPLGAVGFSLGDVLLFFATAIAGVLLARFVRALLEEDVFPRTKLARGVPHAISATVRYAILFGSFLIAAAAAGFDWSRITLLAGAFGVGIGFGLQNIVNNFISGLILLYERPIQVGDTVEVGSLVGEVKRIGIRSSSVRTWQGAEVIVPNGNLIAEQVVNWTLSDRTRRIEIPVGVAYAADPDKVLALLEEVGAAHPDVMSDPAPMALFMGFGDCSLNFELRVWSANFDRVARVRSEISIAIHRVLKDARIEIPFPQRDVRLVIDKQKH